MRPFKLETVKWCYNNGKNIKSVQSRLKNKFENGLRRGKYNKTENKVKVKTLW